MRVSTLAAAAGLFCGLSLGAAPGRAGPQDTRNDAGVGRPPPAARPLGSPPGASGGPARPLADAELYRLLLVLSAETRPPLDLLVACYPFGRPGWRDCVARRGS